MKDRPKSRPSSKTRQHVARHDYPNAKGARGGPGDRRSGGGEVNGAYLPTNGAGSHISDTSSSRITSRRSQEMMSAFNMHMGRNHAHELMLLSAEDLHNGVDRRGNRLVKPKSSAAASSSVMLWVSQDGKSKHGIVRKTKALGSQETWKMLEDVDELTIEDEDGKFMSVMPRYDMLRKVKVLNIKWSKMPSAPAELTQLPLVCLRLQRNMMKSVDILMGMASLLELDVSCNQIQSLPKSICTMRHLKYFFANGNQIVELPEEIGALKSLEELHVASNVLHSLPESIGDLVSLRALDISLNIIRTLPDSIGMLDNLCELHASGNRLVELPHTLKECEQLQYIHMRHNQFTKIPEVLKDMKNLELVNFRHNLISKMEYPIPSVKVLLLDINRLVKVPSAVIDSKNLEVLSMENNQLKDIPADIQYLHKLRALNVNSNRISAIPTEVCHLEELRHLSMKSTRIKSLPAAFNGLNRLTVLDISDTDVRHDVASQYIEDHPNVKVGMNNTTDRKMAKHTSMDYD